MTPTRSFSPLFGSTVGFDRYDDLLDTLARFNTANDGHPAYNIERSGDDYTITLAVAGFGEADLKITVRDNTLVVTGERAEEAGVQAQYLHRGIGLRNFERSFRLADYIVVKDAELKHGLLSVRLVREVPEEQKPRKIEIRTSPRLKTIETAKKVA